MRRSNESKDESHECCIRRLGRTMKCAEVSFGKRSVPKLDGSSGTGGHLWRAGLLLGGERTLNAKSDILVESWKREMR